MRKIVKNALILTLISLICGIGLGFAHEITKEPISAAKEAKKKAAYTAVLPGGETFEDYAGYNKEQARTLLDTSGLPETSVEEAVIAKAGETVIGYILTVSDSEGYGGSIQMTVGLDADGRVTGISFLSIAESPGLGMQAQDDPEWARQYVGRNGLLQVVKGETSDEDQISAISGATVTSKAVTGGVNAALVYYENELKGGTD